MVDSSSSASYSLWELKSEQSFFYIINKSASKSVAPLSSLKEGSLTNRFHVAVRLFSIRSQMTSKCGKNKEVAHEPRVSVSLMFLPHFVFLCDLLLNRPTATWNVFVLYNEQKGKMANLPPISWLFDDLSQFRCFSNHKRYFSSLLLVFFFIFLEYSSLKRFSTPSLAKRRIIVKAFCKTASLS